MKYWITIKDSIEEATARDLYDKIESTGANMIVLENQVDIYGDATEIAISKILFLAGKLGAETQFHIG